MRYPEVTASPRWFLRVIAGPLGGTEVSVVADFPLVIGRAEGANVIVEGPAVSRRHAAVTLEAAGVMVEDLGSTNGTFVNDERIVRRLLAVGDRISVGDSVFVLASRDQDTLYSAPPRRVSLLGDEMPWMAGKLEQIPIADLVQLLASLRKSGVLKISADREASVIFHEGEIRQAEIDGLASTAPEKALFRILGWSAGEFRFDPPEPGGNDPRALFGAGVQELLLEGYRQMDELARLLGKLPPADRRLIPGTRAPEPTVEAALVRLAVDTGTVGAFLDGYPRTDLEAAEALLDLIGKSLLYVDVEPSTSDLVTSQ